MYSSKKGRQSSGYQATTDDDRQSSGSLKSNPARPPEKGLKCPRCDSSNTKFCYYNNYSLKQPRYFCKACRRYWTSGGALRTVPFGGGGGRKRKQIVEPSSKFIKNHDYYSTGVFNFFQGFNPPPVDFELATHSPGATNPGQGMNFTLSSIESLSSINQDIYWKLQQQRLALLFGGENQNKKEINHAEAFAMGNCSRKEGANGNLAIETWPFDSSYATTSYSNIAINYGSNGIHEGTSSWVNGIQPWTDLNQYSGAVA